MKKQFRYSFMIIRLCGVGGSTIPDGQRMIFLVSEYLNEPQAKYTYAEREAIKI